MNRWRFALSIVLLACVSGIVAAQEIKNWPAPALWSPEGKAVSKGNFSPENAEAVEGVPTPPLHFVALNPCRLVDTRGNGFTGSYGPPALTQGVARDFVLTGQCGISPTAQAVSLNVTVTNTQGPGFILIYPQGGAQPTVSTLNYVAGETVANAAVVPLGASGGITVIAGVSGADLILDTNGDYRAGVVTSLNGISGNVTLASEQQNVTITPVGQVLSLAVTGLLPPGTENQTLRHTGEGWVASSALTNNDVNVGLTGALLFPSQARAFAGGSQMLEVNQSDNNTFLGVFAGDAALSGLGNTGVGFNALRFTGNLSGGNAAVGVAALQSNVSGGNNSALGSFALENLTSGSGNIAIGTNAGINIETGSNNILIGNPGSANESGQIRIGTVASITSGTVIVGIHNFGSVGGIPVLVNSGGRLGTTSSSARVKEDVRDIGPESEGLMSLRPVAFRYKEDHEPGGLRQYGLLAEEVAEVYPELVVYDEQGRPQAIRSQLLDPLLLNEVQKQRREIEMQRREIEELKARLAKLAVSLEEKARP